MLMGLDVMVRPAASNKSAVAQSLLSFQAGEADTVQLLIIQQSNQMVRDAPSVGDTPEPEINTHPLGVPGSAVASAQRGVG